jgi:hypothetical protein
VSLPFPLSLGVGRRALTCAGVYLNQARRSLFSKENNDGSGGDHAHLVRSKQDGVGRSPCCLPVGGDVHKPLVKGAFTNLCGFGLDFAVGRQLQGPEIPYLIIHSREQVVE